MNLPSAFGGELSPIEIDYFSRKDQAIVEEQSFVHEKDIHFNNDHDCCG
jgi:hypothetical protein